MQGGGTKVFVLPDSSPLSTAWRFLFQKRMVLERAPVMTHSELILGKSITMETANHSLLNRTSARGKPSDTNCSPAYRVCIGAP